MSTTPIRGLGMGKLIVETPQTPLGQPGMPPAAESTKKLGPKHYPANLGESFLGSKDQETIQSSSKFTPESRAGTLDTEGQPSSLHLGPTPQSLGGGLSHLSQALMMKKKYCSVRSKKERGWQSS